MHDHFGYEIARQRQGELLRAASRPTRAERRGDPTRRQRSWRLFRFVQPSH